MPRLFVQGTKSTVRTGKSTLQKQFQLYYASQSLDTERPSWTPIVHFNIVKAVRMMLDELDFDFAKPADGTSEEPLQDPVTAQSDINALRTKLTPLVAMEDSFASELNGGISVSGGRTGIYVRAGWQTLINPVRTRPMADTRFARPQVVGTLVARNLGNMHREIDELWQHPAVQRLVRLRRLRLEESAPL